MANINFIQTATNFKLVSTRCLRNEYFHNDCRICIDLCPKDSLDIVRGKIKLDASSCVECGGCVGSCPTEALELDVFDPNSFSINYAQNPQILSCKSSTPCLGIFDSEHYMVMALRSKEDLKCDLSHCDECVLNRDSKIKEAIETKIESANSFLSKIGAEQQISAVYESVESDRRALFKKGFSKIKDNIASNEPSESVTALHYAQLDTKLPLKRVLLKNSLKELDINESVLEDGLGIWFNKSIDFQSCTNCGDCIQFCPTDALFATSDKQGIYFSQGKCIGCEICIDICKPKAINHKSDGLDLINIIYDRSELLVHYELVMCRECRTPHPYKGDDPICDRCKDFVANNSDMFVLAKDL